MSEENISVLSSDSSTTLQVDNAALIEELENNDGDTVYPVTIDKAIYCSDGTRFDNKLQKYVHWSDDTSAEAPDVRIADNLGGQYTATDITNMSNSINTISNNLAQLKNTKSTTIQLQGLSDLVCWRSGNMVGFSYHANGQAINSQVETTITDSDYYPIANIAIPLTGSGNYMTMDSDGTFRYKCSDAWGGGSFSCCALNRV